MDVFLTVDSYKISQVFRNLMSNALKFASAGQEVVIDAEFIPASSKQHHDYFSLLSQVLPMASVASAVSSPTNLGRGRVYVSDENLTATEDGRRISTTNTNTNTNNTNNNNVEDAVTERAEKQVIPSDVVQEQQQKQSDDHCNIITAAQTEQHDIENNLPPRGQGNRSSVTSVISVTSVAPSVLSPPNLLDIGNHHYYEIDMIRIAVTDFGVGISKVIILHYHLYSFSLIDWGLFVSIDRRIKSACLMKLYNSMQPRCSKGKDQALGCGVSATSS